MAKILVRTHDEEPLDVLEQRIQAAIEPEIDKLDTVNKEYVITVEITELP